ncbi:MAG TPA: PepSY-associated TM helix domain-containing protein [Chitinophagaceae bacterium]
MQKKRTAWQKTRKTFRDIHLWLGLTSGIIVVAICFSGTIYVFNTELTERAAPHLYKVDAEDKSLIQVDSLVRNVEMTTGGIVTNAVIPHSASRSYQFSVKMPSDSTPRGGTVYMVNPYTSEILGTSKDKNGTKEFMSTMFSLHRWLLLDRVKSPIIKGVPNKELGSMITGIATIIFTLGCLTGLVIWFPQKVRNWRQGLKIKWKASWKRVNHDLHNTLAFYALFFLLLMGLTGPQWSFPWYREGLQKVLGTYKPADTAKKPAKQDKKVSADSLVARLPLSYFVNEGNKALAYEGNYSIAIPAEPGAPVVLTKTKTGFFAPAAGDRISLHQQTGKVQKIEIFQDKPFNERIAGSIKAIHVGNVYGTFTKIIYFLACLIATTLPITGTLIWVNKLKKRRKKALTAQAYNPAIEEEEEEEELAS